jgi:hypothetical protein
MAPFSFVSKIHRQTSWIGPIRVVSSQKDPKTNQKVWTVTVIVRTFLRYYSMSDIFGLAYLVGQIED